MIIRLIDFISNLVLHAYKPRCAQKMNKAFLQSVSKETQHKILYGLIMAMLSEYRMLNKEV